MKEDLLVALNSKRQIKKWRNISIILICLILILALNKLSKKSDINNEIILNDSIAEINIEGVIVKDTYRDQKISEITKNDRIKAVILNIDSPGGMVTPSETLYNLLEELNKKKPLVILMGGIATSGAYMVSLASDYLIASNTTLTGSIGVILQSFEVVELAKKIGIDISTFKSSELKGMPSYFEKNNENSNKAIQSTIDDVYTYFSDLVRSKRKMTEDNFNLAVNGQAFTGRQALKIGLIDEIGDRSSALNYLKEKNINIDLPIKKIDLRKKTNTNIFKKFINFFFGNLEMKNYIKYQDRGFISIFNI